MLKIGIDAHMLEDRSGGNESYYKNILLNMDIPSDCKIYLFVKQGVDISAFENKFKIITFKSKNAFIRNFLELSVLCKQLNLDILHTQYFIPFIRPCKVVCTIHDICFEHFKNIFTKKEYYRQKFLIPYAAKHSSLIFTVSNHAKEDIMKHYHISEKRVVVTYNAVSDAFRKIPLEKLHRQELREKYGITNDYILSVGNLQPRKNLIRLIKSFISMKNTRASNEQLVIVGKKAWMFNDILKAAIENSNDIIFTDYVSKEDLIRLYNDAIAFIYPSFFEGFGIPPLEAMACGTAVAVANATSLPEVVGDGGIYFDPFDENDIQNAMERLLDDSELRDTLIKRSQKQVSRFNWKESSNKIIEKYLEIGSM